MGRTITIKKPKCGITQLECQQIIDAGISNGEKLIRPIEAIFFCNNQCNLKKLPRKEA